MRSSRRLPTRRLPARRSAGSLAVSFVLHAAIAAGFVRIVFQYPLGSLIGVDKPAAERVQYVKVPLQPPGTRGARASVAATPVTTPTAVSSKSGTATSVAGSGTAGESAGAGVAPRAPDARIALDAAPLPPRLAERADSALAAAIKPYNDSLLAEKAKRQPGDWTFIDRNGRKWGMDTLAIRLGPLGVAVKKVVPFPIETRRAEQISRDVREHADQYAAMVELNAGVRRIRERKERERLAQRVIPVP